MKPNTEWMAEKFAEYNRKYFNGSLTEPKFSLSCPDDMLGQYLPDAMANRFTGKISKIMSAGTLCLNGKYSRSEKDWTDTLLHEMIHIYTITVQRKNSRTPHGDDFMSMAAMINKDGWGVSEKNELNLIETDNEAHVSRPEGIFCIINKPRGKNYKVWGFNADPETLYKFIETAKSLKPAGATEISLYSFKSKGLSALPHDSGTLVGIGAGSTDELMATLRNVTGENITAGNFRMVRKIPL